MPLYPLRNLVYNSHERRTCFYILSTGEWWARMMPFHRRCEDSVLKSFTDWCLEWNKFKVFFVPCSIHFTFLRFVPAMQHHNECSDTQNNKTNSDDSTENGDLEGYGSVARLLLHGAALTCCSRLLCDLSQFKRRSRHWLARSERRIAHRRSAPVLHGSRHRTFSRRGCTVGVEYSVYIISRMSRNNARWWLRPTGQCRAQSQP